MIGGLVLQLIFETEGEVKILPERTGLEIIRDDRRRGGRPVILE
jgi:hypothetical protein